MFMRLCYCYNKFKNGNEIAEYIFKIEIYVMH